MKYTRVDGYSATIERCPVCGAQSNLWRFSENDSDPISHVVMCDYGGAIGQRDALLNDGCLLLMPPKDFYQPRKIQAINYWNDFAIALRKLRATNTEVGE